jgi:hypothetical protein
MSKKLTITAATILLILALFAGRGLYIQNLYKPALIQNTNSIASSKVTTISSSEPILKKLESNLRAKISDIRRIDPLYAADFSDDHILIGASHNVFVGKVIQQVSAKERGAGPETQFKVQVVGNIKGDLKGDVTVNQQGGYVNGVLYVVGEGTRSGDVTAPAKSGTNYLLQPGSTYLFATRYSSQQDWYTLNPYPTASKLLSSDSLLGAAALKSLAQSDGRVQQLTDAYPNETSLDADVKHGNSLNSFKEFSALKANASRSTSTLETAASSSVTASTSDSSN